MDTVEFEIVLEAYSVDESQLPTIHPIVNGVQLREIARTVEHPFAEADGQPNLAGAYMGLSAREDAFAWARDYFLSEGWVDLLGCTCLDIGCWPLRARIEISETTVVWRDFDMPFRSWDHTSIGPFVFDRVGYVEALDAAAGFRGPSRP